MKFFRLKQKPEPPTLKVTIRHLRKTDLPALEWNGEYTHFRRMYADTYRNATLGRTVLWIAEVLDVGVIGQVFIQLHSSRPELADGFTRAYLFGFRIQPPYRNKGIGSRMMDTVEEDLIERGYLRITLNVAKDNPEARRLYERRGYQVVAEEPGQWSYVDHEGVRREVNEPSWRMEKELVVD